MLRHVGFVASSLLAVLPSTMAQAMNPIVSGFSPDPSIVKVDDWYYLATSSFHIWPGLPIYASRDLVSWQHIGLYTAFPCFHRPVLTLASGNAISRKEQLSLSGARTRLFHRTADSNARLATGGLYAPTIRYHNGTFFIVCTNSVRGPPNTNLTLDMAQDVKNNFIVTSTDIWGDQWHDPVPFDFDGIDPDIYFEDGKTYITGAGSSAKMMLFEVNPETGEKLTEERAI